LGSIPQTPANFSLSLLGGTALVGPHGPVAGPATQRRRIALLALLATSPGRRATRDKLIAVLWPDHDTERARHLLSESIYVLRKALGESLVVASGDELVLDGQIVTTDVGAFEKALEAGDLAAATSVYGGPFLDGFFLPDAAEFERWVAGERARLDREYRAALESLARELEGRGDVAGAVGVWRKLAALDPYSSRIALDLMRALEAAGERAMALQHARVHSTLVREEFGVEPDAEVVAVVERMRVGNRESGIGNRTAPIEPAPNVEATAATVALPVPRATTRRWVGVGLASVAIAVAGWAGWRATAKREAAAPAPNRSIAVLPFLDLSPEAQQEYFTDGLSEELINRLANVDGLRVAARTSSFTFKGKNADVGEIGRKLGVETLVEGSVRKDGERLRITAQLINTADGYHLWSHQYDLPLSDVFQVQEDIAAAIASALLPRLNGGTTTVLARKPAPNAAAYNLYLRGRHLWNQRTPESLQQALTYFQQAIARDSTYAAAYSGLADTYITLYDYGLLQAAQSTPNVRASATRALVLDPQLAEAHTSLAHLYLHEWNWAASESEFRRAIDLDPGRGPTYHWYALALTTVGRVGDAVAAMRKAVELDPLSPRMNADLGMALFAARDYDRAIEQEAKTLELQPKLPTAHWISSMALEQKGMVAEAQREVEKALELRPNNPNYLASLARVHALMGREGEARAVIAQIEAQARNEQGLEFFVALGYAALPDKTKAFEWLGKSLDQREGSIRYLKVDPRLDGLRADPRYASLLERAGLKP
jgi:adenylate cyclase